jgi:hypothetical protein
MLPRSRPRLKLEDFEKLLSSKHPQYVKEDLFFFGIRGYYKKTMGDPAKNDRKIYDDAIGIYYKGQIYMFNGNVDPGAFKKGIANLVPGIYSVYKFDIHEGRKEKYPAICQRYGTVTVLRDQTKLDTGNFGINIHKGGNRTVSSKGCQTIPPNQWSEFYNTAKKFAIELFKDKWDKTKFTYILLEN